VSFLRPEASEQVDQERGQGLLETRECAGCALTGAVLEGVNLEGVAISSSRPALDGVDR
jgi:hypothetical protein